MVCVPGASVEVLNVAVVTVPTVLSVPCPILVEPSKKVTAPVGFPEPFGVTVAVNITIWPNADGLSDELMPVDVVIRLELLTVCPPSRVPLLPAKLLSPL